MTSAIRMALGVVFLWGSVWKLYQPYEFLRNVYNYDLLGPNAGVVVAWLLPWVELVIGIALILNVMGRGSLLIGTLLLSSFLVAESYALSRGQEIPCGCFSAEGDPIGYRNLFTTGAALLGSVFLLYRMYRPTRSPRDLPSLSTSPSLSPASAQT